MVLKPRLVDVAAILKGWPEEFSVERTEVVRIDGGDGGTRSICPASRPQKEAEDQGAVSGYGSTWRAVERGGRVGWGIKRRTGENSGGGGAITGCGSGCCGDGLPEIGSESENQECWWWEKKERKRKLYTLKYLIAEGCGDVLGVPAHAALGPLVEL